MEMDCPYRSLAETYDAIRPGYPSELIDDILTQAAPAGTDVLMEIGAGTGKATQMFLERGFSVDAVELDTDMAALLERKLRSPKLRLSVSSFETWQPPRRDYSLIYCAQAFHWLDGDTKFGRCAELLVSGGYLALFWYDPMRPADSAAYLASEQVKSRYFGPALSMQTVSMDTRKREIQEAKEFAPVFQQQYDIILHNTPEQALAAMQSTPAFGAAMKKLPEKQQQAFFKEFTAAVEENGGVLDAPMRYSLYLLRKK